MPSDDPSRARPCITGVGLVTPLGGDVRANWNALLEGQFLTDHARIDSPGSGRIGRIASAAAAEAMRQAGWGSKILQDPTTAMVIGTGKGDVEGFIGGIAETPFSIFDFPLSVNVAGRRLAMCAACASGLHALIRAALLLQSGDARRALVIGAEAAVHPLFLASFQRLGVLADRTTGCRPFDLRRRGFFMSEAAAAVCLERADDAGSHAIVTIERSAMGADPTHLTGCDPRGTVLKSLLLRVGASGADLIHAHGTGTVLNDAAELAAVDGVLTNLEGARPILYSHKAALGHSLGASGLVSVVINCLCHRHGLVPGNVRTGDPMPAENLTLDSRPIQRPIRRSAVLAGGFGGTLAAVMLSSP